MTYYSESMRKKRIINVDDYIINSKEYKKIEDKKNELEAINKMIAKLVGQKNKTAEEKATTFSKESYYDDILITKNDCDKYYKLSNGECLNSYDENSIVYSLGSNESKVIDIIIGSDIEKNILYQAKYFLTIDNAENVLHKTFKHLCKLDVNIYQGNETVTKRFIFEKYHINYRGFYDKIESFEEYVRDNVNFLRLFKEGFDNKDILNIMLIDHEFRKVEMSTHEILGLSKEFYDDVIKNGIISEIIGLIVRVGKFKERCLYCNNEMLDAFLYLKERFCDFAFYGICSYSVDSDPCYPCEELKLESLFVGFTFAYLGVFKDKYKPLEFAKITSEILLNQGYMGYQNMLEDLDKYFSLCNEAGIVADKNPQQLKQWISIFERNNKLSLKKDIKTFYEGFKDEKIDNFIIMYPKKIEDLKIDGCALNYCIASDILKISKGEGLTFFLREQENTPLIKFTMSKGKIKNIKNIHNDKLTPEQCEAIDKWLKNIINKFIGEKYENN